MTEQPGLPRDDAERGARWCALVAAQRAEIRRLRQAAAEAARELRYGHADPADVARLLLRRTQP